MPDSFKHIPAWILRMCVAIDTRLKRPFLAAFYRRVWNPANYALVCGIGVGINMIVAWAFWTFLPLPWWLINGVAILCAWAWNWTMSLGPLGWLWGFKERKKKD